MDNTSPARTSRPIMDVMRPRPQFAPQAPDASSDAAPQDDIPQVSPELAKQLQPAIAEVPNPPAPAQPVAPAAPPAPAATEPMHEAPATDQPDKAQEKASKSPEIALQKQRPAPPKPAREGSGVGLAITLAVLAFLALSGIAIYAYLMSTHSGLLTK